MHQDNTKLKKGYLLLHHTKHMGNALGFMGISKGLERLFHIYSIYIYKKKNKIFILQILILGD